MALYVRKPPGSATDGSPELLSFSQATKGQIAELLSIIKQITAAFATIDPAALAAHAFALEEACR